MPEAAPSFRGAGPCGALAAYRRRHAAMADDPAAFLVGQLTVFLAIALYVKLVQMRLTPEYASAWVADGRSGVNAFHFLLFAAQELTLFAACLLVLRLWQRLRPSGSRYGRTTAVLVGLVVLPLLSLVEVMGLEHYALFLMPIGPNEISLLPWVVDLVRGSNVLESTAVRVGLLLILLGYYVGPPSVWWAGAPRPRRGALVGAGAMLAGSALLWLLPKPPVTNAVLEPHPVLWLAFGNRGHEALAASTGMPEEAPAAERIPIEGRTRYVASPRPTNIVLFVLESTRAESIALYDETATAGHQLARLRDEIAVFDHVYAPVPHTGHAIFALLYGRYPLLDAFSANPAVAAESLARTLARAGYATHFYITGDLDFEEIRQFAAPGFARVLDLNHWPGQERYTRLKWGPDDRLLIDEAKRFIAAQGERPFFLFAMTSNPHYPYDTRLLPPDEAFRFPRLRYERLVDYDLELLVEFYQWLKREGVAERTLVLVVGDHGEGFEEHPGDVAHSRFIYAQNVHVPCFILHPTRLGLPPRIAQVGSQVDLRATILAILGLPDPLPGDGVSLLRETPERSVVTFMQREALRIGLRDRQYSYIYTSGTEREELFDRLADPAEQQNLAAEKPDLAGRYRTRLREWHQRRHAALVPTAR